MCLLLTLTSCLSPHPYAATIHVSEPAPRYADLEIEGAVADKWWQAYGDEHLNAYVDRVLAENLTIQVAYLRIVDAQLAQKQAHADYYPKLGFNAGAGVGGRVDSDTSTANQNYNMGLSLGYEVDLWGRVRAEARVSELGTLAARDAVETAIMGLVGQIVTDWFALSYFSQKRILTQRLLELSEDYRKLAQNYYLNGATTGADLLDQDQQIASLKASLLDIDTQTRLAKTSLEILANSTQAEIKVGALPQAIDLGGTVSPSLLLLRRPDVRSARRQAEQADARITIAFANRLPSLKLSAALGLRAPSITELFKTLIWDVAGSFVASLFDGFKQTTAIDRAKVTFLQERLGYRVVVNNAVADVESTLLMHRLRQQQLINSTEELARRSEILEASRQYFIGGLISYDRLLMALRQLVSATQAELDAKRALLLAQVAVFKAMGGGPWLNEASSSGEKIAQDMLKALDDKDE